MFSLCSFYKLHVHRKGNKSSFISLVNCNWFMHFLLDNAVYFTDLFCYTTRQFRWHSISVPSNWTELKSSLNIFFDEKMIPSPYHLGIVCVLSFIDFLFLLLIWYTPGPSLIHPFLFFLLWWKGKSEKNRIQKESLLFMYMKSCQKLPNQIVFISPLKKEHVLFFIGYAGYLFLLPNEKSCRFI